MPEIKFDFKKKSSPQLKIDIIPIIVLIILSILLSLVVYKFVFFDNYKTVQFKNVKTYIEANLNDLIKIDIQVYDRQDNLLDFDFKVNLNNSLYIRQINTTTIFSIIKSGYSKVDIELFGYHHTMYLFVAPIPSKFSLNKFDIDYYKTQFNTGIVGNCGPSTISMSLLWSKNINIDVKDIRDFIGLPKLDGGIGFYHMEKAFKYYEVNYKFNIIKNRKEIFDIIDSGSIVIVLFNTKGIKYNPYAKKDLFGRYYLDNGGHYIIIKGYSLNQNYFIVYDPIPADWIDNKFRYEDGISMIGKNRYYKVDDIFRFLNRKIIQIF